MSLKFMASESWRITYKGTLKWSGKTPQFGEHGLLFERVVSFEDIPNLEFSMKLTMPILFQSPQMEGGSIMKQLPKKQCAVCKKEFDSRNDLFDHLEAFGHAI